jgi:hypothetical protein
MMAWPVIKRDAASRFVTLLPREQRPGSEPANGRSDRPGRRHGTSIGAVSHEDLRRRPRNGPRHHTAGLCAAGSSGRFVKVEGAFIALEL